jgi:hypothetical protein
MGSEDLAIGGEADFERAMAEASRLLDALPEPQSAEDHTLGRLLSQIAEYHDSQPPVQQNANLGRLQALDKRLKTFGRRWPITPRAMGDEHWEPMLGGDVDPHHKRTT